MPTSNFKLFDENKANMMDDSEYGTNQQRLNGVQTGVASSQLQNKTLYQVSLMSYALGQLMVQNGYDCSDTAAVTTFVNNLGSTFLQKVVDKASEEEAKAGLNNSKYITPATMKAIVSLIKTITGSTDPTKDTAGDVGQFYINTETKSLFVCVLSVPGAYEWRYVPFATITTKTEIITATTEWTVPPSVTKIFVRLFGGGGYGSFAGGGSGEMQTKEIEVVPNTKYQITIGAGATIVSTNGQPSSFGQELTANGGSCAYEVGSQRNGGNGGAGGGGRATQAPLQGYGPGIGGNGQYGGGGGGGAHIVNYVTSTNGNGGNGGQYGGGGGGGSCGYGNYGVGVGGSGGTYGGKGGDGIYVSGNGNSGANGTNTTELNLDFKGTGVGGTSTATFGMPGGGGGGGYGGPGGNATVSGGSNVSSCGAGGGGFGAKGGDSKAEYNYIGGGGGGYGGPGGPTGGAGGYGPDGEGGKGKMASGGGAAQSGEYDLRGGDGVCVIQYNQVDLTR